VADSAVCRRFLSPRFTRAVAAGGVAAGGVAGVVAARALGPLDRTLVLLAEESRSRIAPHRPKGRLNPLSFSLSAFKFENRKGTI